MNTTWFVTRHPGALDWAEQSGVAFDRLVVHLDPTEISRGDVVIGTLPVNLAAEVCARGGRYFNLSLQLPREARGKELSHAELIAYGARIEEYKVEKVL